MLKLREILRHSRFADRWLLLLLSDWHFRRRILVELVESTKILRRIDCRICRSGPLTRPIEARLLYITWSRLAQSSAYQRFLSIKPNSDFFLPPLHGHRACNTTPPTVFSAAERKITRSPKRVSGAQGRPSCNCDLGPAKSFHLVNEELSPCEEFSLIARARSRPADHRRRPERRSVSFAMGEQMIKGIITALCVQDAAFHSGSKAKFQFPLLLSQHLTHLFTVIAVNSFN